MRKIILALAIMLGALSTASAHDYTLGGLTIDHPHARPSMGGMRTSATFMMIANKGDHDDKLVAASSDAAKRVELHEHIFENDVAKMRRVKGGIAVPAGGMAALKPGGYHIMLMDLTKALEEGDSFAMTLSFEHAGDITIEVPVLEIMAETMDHSAMEGEMDHNAMEGEMDHGEMDHNDMNHSDMNHSDSAQ